MLETKSNYVLHGYVQISALKILEDKFIHLNRKVNVLILFMYMDLRLFHFNHCPITYKKHTPVSKIILICINHPSCPLIIVRIHIMTDCFFHCFIFI